MPRVFGASLLHVSEVDAIVENSTPLTEVHLPETSSVDAKVAAIIADMIDDRACLQMGIGALPGAVCALLHDRKDLGIHTELMTPALAGLIHCGAVTNQAKTTYRGRSVFTFAMGDRAFYDFLDDNPAFHSAPVNIVNDPRHIAKNRNVVSVNATLQIDLGGACQFGTYDWDGNIAVRAASSDSCVGLRIERRQSNHRLASQRPQRHKLAHRSPV